MKKIKVKPVEEIQEEIKVSEEPETEIHESSPLPASQIIAQGDEVSQANEALKKINHGRVVFDLLGKPYSIRWPTASENLISQVTYAREFHKMIADGIPCISQLDIEKILPPAILGQYQKRLDLIGKGYYDYSKVENLEDWELPEAEEVNQNRIAQVKVQLMFTTLTENPVTVLHLSYTAENLAQQAQNLYLIWAGLEKEENGKWIRAYSTFEEFKELSQSLIDFLSEKRNELVEESFDFLSELPRIATNGSGSPL